MSHHNVGRRRFLQSVTLGSGAVFLSPLVNQLAAHAADAVAPQRFVFVIVLFFGCGTLAAAVPTWEPAKVYIDPDGKELHYFLAKPVAIEPGKKYPLIVFMHGGGARGKGHTKDSSKYFLEERVQAKYLHFLVAPQQPSGKTWSNHGYGEGAHKMDANPSLPIKLAFGLIESLPKDIPEIDVDRVYLVGVSNGGYATWDMIARKPELFAAAAPMEGGGDPSQVATMLNLPIWASHGSQDKVVPVSGTRAMVEALKKAGGNIQYLEYEAGHGGWNKTLAEMPIMDWLFAQKRTGK